VSLQVQSLTLLLMVASGGALGILFDTYRVVSGQLRLHRLFISMFDVLYWLAATLLVFRVLYYSNMGDVRLFIFLGLLLGISAYFALLSPWTIKAVKAIIHAITVVSGWCVQLFQLFIIKPLLLLYKCFMILLGFLAAVSIFLYKVVLQLLYPFWAVIKWLTRPIHRYFRFLVRWQSWIVSAWQQVKRLFRGKQ